jgi:hypothetical protein
VTVRARPAQALPFLLAFVLGLGAAGLTACGDKENPAMIPADNASELNGHLDDVLNAIESENCGDATQAVAQVKADLESLPSGTSQRLLSRLQEGTTALEKQAAKECQGTETATTATPTATAETVTTETVTTPTATTPPTTPTETTPPTTPTETTPPTTTPTDTTGDTGGVEVP